MAVSDWDRRGVSNRTTPGFIYFIQPDVGGLIKIGWATSPASRMAQMQAHGPLILRLLHSEPGNGKQERALHARFGDLRQHGEWFGPGPELMTYIEQRRSLTAVPAYAAAPIEPYVFKGRKPPPMNTASNRRRSGMAR